MAARGTIIIDFEAYRHNLSVLSDLLSADTKLMAVIKANAYGHGLVEIAKAAVGTGIEWLGVSTIDEARQVREAGITANCLILSPCDEEMMQKAVDLDVGISLMSPDGLNKLEGYATETNKVVKIHLYVDTGMQRGGINPAETIEVAQAVLALPHLLLEGVYTHFATAEETDDRFLHQQLNVFTDCIQELAATSIRPPLIHAANSAAALAEPASHFNLVRVGLASYGVNPFPKNHKDYASSQERLHPVLSVMSTVAHIRTIPTGTSVGYNRTWTAERDTKLGLIPVGYGDGLTRSLHQNTVMLIHSQAAPVVGSISMDQTIVDVTDIPDVTIGDEVIIIDSNAASPASVASLATTDNASLYEIVTELSGRLPRKYED